MDKKVKYYIDRSGEFVIENYNRADTFSNFLPGIAGLFGIPMWVFYVNRAQCVCSCGIKSKDNSIMEFLPANRAYQLVSSQGFRTFLKIKRDKKEFFYEPFSMHPENWHMDINQKMYISPYELRLVEIVPELGIETEVIYFTIPNEAFAGLARSVSFKNISKKGLKIDVLDGTPLIIPYGVSNFFLQKMRRTVEAWMMVENIEKKAPFYKLKVKPEDISEVSFIEAGNFYAASLSKSLDKNERLPVIVDSELIFGPVKDFSYPVNFINDAKFRVPSSQMGQNKLPCAMFFSSFELDKAKQVKINAVLGHMSSKEKLNSHLAHFNKSRFFIDKQKENREIIHALMSPVFTSSGEKRYDLYCRQTFLDNVLRGGYPLISGNNSHSFYVYSRKHGDLERDYNRFYLDPTYFSQGNGNFRDMNQNRRNDIFFNPGIKDTNILHFYNLIQPDGFNPLVLHGLKFKLKEEINLNDIFENKLDTNGVKEIKDVLSRFFTPGELFMRLDELSIEFKNYWYDILSGILKKCDTIYEAEHSEGFWIDHWTYNLDLVESYLALYPEKLKELLLDKKDFVFYDTAFYVKPRSERSILIWNNQVRQYHSIAYDKEKDLMIKARKTELHAVRASNGKGEIYKVSLLVKMLCLVGNKMASIDPFGSGIDMEADKPGWCDSMNGLPGLFGSSTPELFELKRQVVFVLESLDSLGQEKIHLPKEISGLLKGIEALIKAEARISPKNRDFYYWDKSNALKEEYRKNVLAGFSGLEEPLSLGELEGMLKTFLSKLNSAVKKTYNPDKGTYSTYFINEVTGFKNLDKLDPVKNKPLVMPTAFKQKKVPLFLEGFVRAMKVEKDLKKAKALYKAVKKTGLYDKKLKMYKINESLEGVSKEIGRSSVFTPGWLENESIWLHMEYKYLLEILKAGLYTEFFEEFKNILIPFQDPEVYGRSIFENSSFIVSTVFPDKKLHGKGFVARLSGSTAEMINIWLLMNVGNKPFFLDKKRELNLRLEPALPEWLFSKKTQNGFPKNTYGFRFLGHTDVIYHNPRRRNTAGRNAVKIRFMAIKYDNGKMIELKKDIIESPYAEDIRSKKIERIDVYLG